MAPYQQAAASLPEIPLEHFRKAVQLVEPDGRVFEGAHAVARLLAHAPGGGWMLRAYERLPGFAPASEWAYGVVARHRGFFGTVTRFLWGRDPRPATYFVGRWLFLRALALVYGIAFLSLAVQVRGLIGSHGVLPAQEFLAAVAPRAVPPAAPRCSSSTTSCPRGA